MSLTVCPDCQRPVSDQAPTCPHCGRPIKFTQVQTKMATEQNSPVRPAAKTQIIKATSKKFTALQLDGAILFVFGIFLFVSFMVFNNLLKLIIYLFFFWMIGICTYLFGRVGGWWFHH